MDSRVRIFLRFILHPRTRYVAAWMVAASAAASTLFVAWTVFDTPRKADGTPQRRGGNKGHAMIDFGGQWLLGRMLAQGQGQHLYHRNYQREVLRQAYPQEDEVPASERSPEEQGQHDAENLMIWFVGQDDPESAKAIASLVTPLAGQDPLSNLILVRCELEGMQKRLDKAMTPQLGGPLYPPTHALLMSPLGLLRPADAYRTTQVLGILLALAAGWGIRLLSQGRIWWPVATAVIVLYPGFSSSLNLGQNSILMLALLIWGWACVACDRPVCGGILWGLLAFKPVWAIAFLLVPILTGRWRFLLAMVATITCLAVATLPFVPLQSWADWWHVGREAAQIYNTDENWIFLSRDLVNIPRRWLLDFRVEAAQRDNLAATLIGWLLLLTVVGCTALLAIVRRDRTRAITGPAAAFVLLGAWLSCFHFMFYDVLLTALPILLLLTEPGRYLQPRLLAIRCLAEGQVDGAIAQYFGPRLASAYPSTLSASSSSQRNIYVLNSMTLTLMALLAITDLLFPLLKIAVSVSAPALEHVPIPLPLKYSTSVVGTPWNTFCVIALWLWCGWLTLRLPAAPESARGGPLLSSAEVPDTAPAHAAQLV